MSLKGAERLRYGLMITISYERSSQSWHWRTMTSAEDDWSGCAESYEEALRRAQRKAEELICSRSER